LVVVALAVAFGAHAQGSGGSSDTTTPGSSAKPSPSETLQEVTVTAQRATLSKRVTAFVGKITKPLLEGGLTLWHRPVCALVSGVTQEEGEFILERISDVARADHIPLGSENCHPNLFILVSKQPQELLTGMSKRNVWFTFGFGAHRRPCEAPAVSPAKVGPITHVGRLLGLRRPWGPI
jgi:hypothetical protein